MSETKTPEAVWQLKEIMNQRNALIELRKSPYCPEHLSEMEQHALQVEEKFEDEIATMESSFEEARTKNDISEMERLSTKLQSSKQLKDQELQAATLRLRNAEKSLKERSGSLHSEIQLPPPQPSSSTKSPLRIKNEIRKSRAILKKAVEAKTTVEAQNVSYEYLCYLTRGKEPGGRGWDESLRLASGGQGSVYKAFDEELNCYVAIKRLRFDNRGSFEREREVRVRLDYVQVVN